MANCLNPEARRELDDLIQNSKKLKRRELQSYYDHYRALLSNLKRKFGAKARLGLYDEITSLPGRSDQVLFVPKYFIEQELFDHYDRVCPLFGTMPPHTRIGVDVNGVHGSEPEVEWMLLEATLFEDMAFLWNSLLDCRLDSANRLSRKRVGMLERATARQAYHLLEGYLNGIAQDILVTFQGSLTSKQRTMLSEWDAIAGKPRFMRLRDKILQYPSVVSHK
jgi:hypothetical protein